MRFFRIRNKKKCREKISKQNAQDQTENEKNSKWYEYLWILCIDIDKRFSLTI